MVFCLTQKSGQVHSKHRLSYITEIILKDALLRTMQLLYKPFSRKTNALIIDVTLS